MLIKRDFTNEKDFLDIYRDCETHREYTNAVISFQKYQLHTLNTEGKRMKDFLSGGQKKMADDLYLRSKFYAEYLEKAVVIAPFNSFLYSKFLYARYVY
jgi:hypothetical protein